MSKRTSLTFQAQAQGVKVNTPKPDSYSRDAAGSIDITFRIQAPKRPHEPHQNDWELRQAEGAIERLGGKEPGEDDKKGRKLYKEALAKIERCKAQHANAMAAYERQLAAHAPALMAYAQLVGLMAVFGNQKMVINIKPAGQDLLPGMGYELALPGPDAGDVDDDGGEL